MTNREDFVAATLSGLVTKMVDEFDLMDLLWSVVDSCAQYLDGAEAGLVLADQRGQLRPTVASSERARLLELLEAQHDEGPCLDAYRSGRPVVDCALDGEGTSRWPSFGPLAAAEGFSVVHAFPMRCRGEPVGALNVFQVSAGGLGAEDAASLQVLTDAATVALVQERAVREAGELSAQLERVLQTRVTLDQATGILAEREGLDVDEALELLREMSRRDGGDLLATAAALVMGRYQVPPPG